MSAFGGRADIANSTAGRAAEDRVSLAATRRLQKRLDYPSENEGAGAALRAFCFHFGKLFE